MASKAPATPVITSAGQKKAETSTANFIAVAVLITFIVVIVAGVLVKGRWAAYQLNRKVMAGQGTAVNNLKADLLAYDSLEQSYQQLVTSGQIKLVNDALPNGIDLTALASALAVQAQQSGVSLGSVASNVVTSTSSAPSASPAPASSSQATPAQIAVVVDGPYTAVLQFLKTIEQSIRPMRVDEVDMTGTAKDTTANITLRTYYATAATVQPGTEVVK